MSNGPAVGLLLVNTGTPDSTRPADVRRYLREFLLDERVIDIPRLQREFLVRVLIVPRRGHKSAAAYRQIWMPEGSPLLVYSQRLAGKLRQRLSPGVVVEVAMRYGNPSIASALNRLRQAGADQLVVLPMFPQYASASYGSVVAEVMRLVAQNWNVAFPRVIPPFFAHPAFIRAIAQAARPVLDRMRPDKVLFSYHGLPERHCKKSDMGHGHCFSSPQCCEERDPAARYCYRSQCDATSRALANALDLTPADYEMCFQSRLGRDPWIRPYTDLLIPKLAADGIKRLVVLTPAFVADCLETLEEIGIRARKSFLDAGGDDFALVPCPNDSDVWADGVLDILREHTARIH